MTVLSIEKLTDKDRAYVASKIKSEGFTIQIAMHKEPSQVFGTEGDILFVKSHPIQELSKHVDEKIEINTYDEFLEWWPSIKKGLGMEA